MEKKRITYAEELNHGDVIRVFSYEQNCGMDETTFTALVVACSDKKKLVIPQDFQGHLYRAAAKGASWEITVDWLLENDVDVFIVERFDQLLTTIWDYLDEEEA